MAKENDPRFHHDPTADEYKYDYRSASYRYHQTLDPSHSSGVGDISNKACLTLIVIFGGSALLFVGGILGFDLYQDYVSSTYYTQTLYCAERSCTVTLDDDRTVGIGQGDKIWLNPSEQGEIRRAEYSRGDDSHEYGLVNISEFTDVAPARRHGF